MISARLRPRDRSGLYFFDYNHDKDNEAREESVRAEASILVGVLWCLALLSIIVIGLLHTARLDLLVGKHHSDRIQAHYLALAGIEKTKALLYQSAQERSRTGQSHRGDLYNAPEQFRNVSLGRGQFRVFRRGREDEGGEILYGVSDEESRLNVNVAPLEDLLKIEGMTPDIAAAIIDWRDEDNAVTPGGAEAEYYLSLQPPYLPRNGPLQTVRELLMVRGVSRQLLFGTDVHQNGGLDVAGKDEPASAAGALDAGWAGLLTVDSLADNLNAAGEERVNIQTAAERALAAVKGITSEIAKAIVAYRGQKRFESIADLLDVTAVQNQTQLGSLAIPGAPGATTTDLTQSAGPQNAGLPNQPASSPSGPKVVSQELLMEIADDLTVQSVESLPGLVNINTAGLAALACLPGLDRQLAQAIISYRQSSGFFPNTAHLLKVQGLTRESFKQVAPRVAARSETFRILSEGRVTSTGARQRIQEIVHIGLHNLTTLSYREDDL